MLDYLAANADFACDYIAKNAPVLKAFRPDAGFGLWIDFNPTGLTHEQLCDMFVNEALVAVSDGASFGAAEGSGFIRLNIGVPRSVLTEGLNRITNALQHHLG